MCMILFGVGLLSLDKGFANVERPVEGQCSSHEAVSYQRKRIVHIDRKNRRASRRSVLGQRPQHLVIKEREYKSLYDWCQLVYHHARSTRRATEGKGLVGEAREKRMLT